MDIIGYHTAAVFILILIAAVILDGGMADIYLKSAVMLGQLVLSLRIFTSFILTSFVPPVGLTNFMTRFTVSLSTRAFSRTRLALSPCPYPCPRCHSFTACYRYAVSALRYATKSEYDYGNENLCQRKAFFTFKAFKQLHAIRSFHPIYNQYFFSHDLCLTNRCSISPRIGNELSI